MEGIRWGAVTYLDDLFLVNPLPNSYFTRDSSINIADDVILSHMGKPYRQREPLLMKYIHRAADEYRDNPTQDFCSMELPYGIEGGDVLILSDKVVCIGCTERTQPAPSSRCRKPVQERFRGRLCLRDGALAAMPCISMEC